MLVTRCFIVCLRPSPTKTVINIRLQHWCSRHQDGACGFDRFRWQKERMSSTRVKFTYFDCRLDMKGSRATVLVAWQRMMTMDMALLYHSISPLAALLIISSSPIMPSPTEIFHLLSSSVSNRARSRGLWLLKVDRSLLGLTPENQKTVNRLREYLNTEIFEIFWFFTFL